MSKYLFYTTFFTGFLLIEMSGQNRLILNQNVFTVLNNSVYLVVNNSNTNAVTTIGTGGSIISETENNRVKWNIGTNSGNYVVPFAKNTANKIPLSVNISNAGVGSGNIVFSTYGGSTWDNSTYTPSGVTNMYGSIATNNSNHVIDRFWLIDALGYSTRPVAGITFTYIDAEHSAAGNVITESNLFAQRYYTATNYWGGWYGAIGTANTVLNTVNTGTIPATEFNRVWTLVDNSYPLPIELVYFKGNCGKESTVSFDWATASEINNAYFTIEGSSDGVNWNTVQAVNGSINSTSMLYYNISVVVNNYIYFRLKQTDLDHTNTYSGIIYVNCETLATESVIISPNPNNGELNLQLFDLIDEKVEIKIIDALGQLVFEKEIVPDMLRVTEHIKLPEIAQSIYFINVITSRGIICKKINVLR